VNETIARNRLEDVFAQGRNVRQSALSWWKAYSTKQKLLFASVFVALVVGIGILIAMMSATEYSTAFTNLTATDAANVKAYLEENQIPYKLSADGTSIGVPSTMVADVKVDVTAQGMVKNGAIGYELFRENMSSWSMTDSQFDVIDADARAGEIQRLIQSMTGVASAEVLLHMPKDSVFLRDTQEMATASAVVSFKPGYPPDQAKIDTIYNLVAKSVPNLTIDHITISDQNGELMPSSKLGEVGVSSLVEQQLRIKKQFESDLQRNVTNFLTPLIGKGNVIVSVVSSLNFDKKTTDQNLVTPVTEGTGIAISRETNEERSEGTSNPIGGVAGTGTTDIPGYPSADASKNTSSDKASRIENFEINRIRNQIVSSPYVVQDLSISVGLNNRTPDGATAPPIEQETIAQVRTLLQSIVAASLANNGQQLGQEQIAGRVSVIARNFETTTTAKPLTWTDMLLYGAIGALTLLVVGAVVFALIRRRRKALDAQVPVPTPVQAPLEEEEYELTITELGKANNNNQIKKQLEFLAKKKPEEFANLLRTWLAEDY
jgi:flagellar M-ring protein FliF